MSIPICHSYTDYFQTENLLINLTSLRAYKPLSISIVPFSQLAVTSLMHRNFADVLLMMSYVLLELESILATEGSWSTAILAYQLQFPENPVQQEFIHVC